jgi:hypothetical protein
VVIDSDDDDDTNITVSSTATKRHSTESSSRAEKLMKIDTSLPIGVQIKKELVDGEFDSNSDRPSNATNETAQIKQEPIDMGYHSDHISETDCNVQVKSEPEEDVS